MTSAWKEAAVSVIQQEWKQQVNCVLDAVWWMLYFSQSVSQSNYHTYKASECISNCKDVAMITDPLSPEIL